MGLDAVEIIMGWENAFDIKLSNDEVCELSTTRQATELISSKVGISDPVTEVCLGLRAYNRIRQAFCSVVEVSRAQIRLDSKLRELLPKKQRADIWKTIFSRSGLPEAPRYGVATGVIFLPITVKDVAIWVVANHPKSLVNPDECWTHSQVRSVVRAVIRDVISIDNFKDDDFARDLGIN